MVKIPKPNLTIVGSWNQGGELSRHAYRVGYLDAAELLAGAIESSEGFDVRLLSIVYPLLNLYRHFVELSLKDFIDLAIFVGPHVEDLYDCNKVRSRREKLSHDLRKAYDVARSIISGIYVPPGLTEHADSCCLELVQWFQDIDGKGDGFRYTLDRKLRAQFPASFPVDLPWLRSRIKQFDLFMHEERNVLRGFLDPDAKDMDDRTYHW
jgi:hypothetical protein